MTDISNYVVPPSGLPAWTVPDVDSTIVAHLDPGTTLQLTERRGAWGHVVCTNGRSLWVDASRLERLGSSAPRSSAWWKSRPLRLVVSLTLCVASPLIYVLGS